MHETHIDQLRTIPLIADEEKRVAFRTELTQLLNRYGIDNACAVPDYLLACYLDSHLITVRGLVSVRDNLHPPKLYRTHVPSDQSHAGDALGYYLNSFQKTAEVLPRCENCDGLGFIPPLKAIDAPILQRWLHEDRRRCATDAHPAGITPVLGRQASDYQYFGDDERYDYQVAKLFEKGGGPCSQ